MKKDENKFSSRIIKFSGAVVIAFFIVFPIIQLYKEKKDEKLLIRTGIRAKAVLKKIHVSKVIHGSYYCVFEFKVSGDNYNVKEIGNYSFFQEGDTFLIEYAKEDPSVARIVDKYYMKKYRHLKR